MRLARNIIGYIKNNILGSKQYSGPSLRGRYRIKLNSDTRILVCARLGDNICHPGRARSIWALNTARAIKKNGMVPILLGRSDNLPYQTDTSEGLSAFGRHVKDLYNIDSDLEFAIPPRENERGEASTPGEWELNSGFIDRLLSNIDFAHVRDPQIMPKLIKAKIPFIYEDHNEDYHINLSKKELVCIKSYLCRRVVAITPFVSERLISSGVPGSKIISEHSGVKTDLARNKERIRSWRGFFQAEGYMRVAFYGGGLQAERGVDQILESASFMPEILFVVAGGTHRDQGILMKKRNEKNLKNVKICGFVDGQTFFDIAQSCDVLLYTRDSGDRINITSPLKFFEYLSAGQPIVSFDIPAVRDELSNCDAITLYRHSNGQSLAEAIRRSLYSFQWRESGYERNINAAKYYDWKDREIRILEAAGILGDMS